MPDVSSCETSFENMLDERQRINRELFALNAFIWGFLLGFTIFWYAVEQGHYRPKSAEAKSQFLPPPK